MEMLKKPWLSDADGRKGFIRQMVQANSRCTEEVEHKYPEVGKTIPVKIIWGKEDQWIPMETAFRLKEKLNARDVVLIEDAGHLVMYDQEGKLGLELGLWLSHAAVGETS
jgi:pimeloyl-ACP methyl ester carboxylesterase